MRLAGKIAEPGKLTFWLGGEINVGGQYRFASIEPGQVTGNLSRIAAVLGVAVEYLMVGDDKRAAGEVQQGDELALLRLYRECEPEDRQMLLRTARRLARH